MAKQTSMQEMIQWAISLKDKEQQCIDWIAIKSKAEELLEKEKEQIIDAATWGALSENNAEQYYNEKYNK
jgi:hypothetical protein